MRWTAHAGTTWRRAGVLFVWLVGCSSNSLPPPRGHDAGSGGVRSSVDGGANRGGADLSAGAPNAGAGTAALGGAPDASAARAGGTANAGAGGGANARPTSDAGRQGDASGAAGHTGAGGADGGDVAGGAGAAGHAGRAGSGGGLDAGSSGADSLPLPIPPVLTPTSTDATTDYYAITVKAGTTQMRAGAPTPIVGFNGIFPGPTIVATKGRAVQVTQTNGWTENITIHNHGHKAPQASDGHPIDYVKPGKSKVYTYPNDQNASTYWYHDHTMDLTAQHVYSGLAGFYLIHDQAEDALELPAGKYDVPLLVQDKSLNDDNTLSYSATYEGAGFMGKLGLVNGVVSPHLDVDTHKYRLRLLNGSNARAFRLALKSGRSFQIIGSDGGLLNAPVTVTELGIAPAERYDIVVDFSKSAIGTTDTLVNEDTSNPLIGNLMEFRVTTSVTDDSAVPSVLGHVTRLQASQAVATVPWILSQDFSSGGTWVINDSTYDPARLDVVSHLGSVYIWKITNSSGFMHPFHKHLTQFQILDIDGQPPPVELSGWKDTVQVGVESTVRIIFADQSFTGTYVFHCHMLEHEDHGMMLQESVVSP